MRLPTTQLLLATVILTGTLGSAHGGQAASAEMENIITLGEAAQAARLESTPVKRKRIGGLITATATIEADARKIAHIAPRIQARVVRLIADLGQTLSAGDPIALMSSAELGAAKANYLKNRSLEAIAAQHRSREERLFRDKIAPERDVLDARANYDTAFAELRSAREALLLLIPSAEVGRLDWSKGDRTLSEFPLTTPIAGTLVKRDLAVGQVVTAEREVVTVIDLDNVWFLAQVFERDIGGLAIGAPVSLTVDAYPDQRFQGVISNLGDVVESRTRTVTARVDVANLDHRLKPGMFAHAEIATRNGSREVLSAPAAAIYEVNGEKAAFLQTSPNTYSLRRVKLGAIGTGDVEIISGLDDGDKVVTRGGLILKAMLVNKGD